MRAKNNWAKAEKALKEKEATTNVSYNTNLYVPQVSDEKPHKSVLRFLPSPDTDLPYQETLTHYVTDDNGEKMVENCPKTIGENCPICDAQNALWQAGREDTYRDRKKKSSYYSNVLVLEDEANPANVGKVFILRFGYAIKNMMDKLVEEEGSLGVIFDYDEGTDFKFIVSKKGKWNNYDDCGFKRTSTALDEEVAKKADADLHDLLGYTDPTKFRSYDEIAQDYQDRTSDAPSAWVKKNLATTSAHSKQKESSSEVKAETAPTPTAVAEAEPASSSFFDNLDD